MPGTQPLPPLPLLGTRVPEVRRVAVLRANGIGDFIVALPALEALRAAYPDAEIVLLGCDWHQEFLAGRPSPVDRCEPVPPSPGVRTDQPAAPAAELEAFLARQRRRRFDLAVQLHGGGRYSNPFVLALGARVTAGARTPDAAPLDRSVPYTPYQHEILRFLEVVSLVGAAPVTLEPRVALTEADRAEAARALGEEDGRPLVVLHPGAGDPRRRWPAERFAAAGRELARRGARLAVIGAAAERPVAGRTLDLLGGGALDLCGKLSLGGLAGVLAQARLVLANDSGPLHLARAVGAGLTGAARQGPGPATVGVFWCGNLTTVGPLLRARHRALISWRLACPACGLDCTRHRCPHDASFVADVSLDEALAAVSDLFEPAAAPPAAEQPVTERSRPCA